MSYKDNAGAQKDVERYKAEITGFLKDRGILFEDETISSTRKGRGNNDAIDAFRHSYVMGRIAMDYNYAIAINAGREHERKVVNDPDERRMDLHNNAVGASIGWDLRNRGNNSPKELFLRIEQAMEDGKLIVYPQQTAPRTGKLRAGVDDTFSEMALAGNIDAPYSKQFASLLSGVKELDNSTALNGLRAGRDDLAAELLRAGANRGFDPQQTATVIAGDRAGEVFANQGAPGSATSLVAKVNVADVRPDSAASIVEDMNRRAPLSQPAVGDAQPPARAMSQA
jgi:hypothetical protein